MHHAIGGLVRFQGCATLAKGRRIKDRPMHPPAAHRDRSAAWRVITPRSRTKLSAGDGRGPGGSPGKGAADIGPNAKGGFFHHHHAHVLSIGRLATRMVGYEGSISRQVPDDVTYCRASISSPIESVYLHFYSCPGWGKGVQ